MAVCKNGCGAFNSSQCGLLSEEFDGVDLCRFVAIDDLLKVLQEYSRI